MLTLTPRSESVTRFTFSVMCFCNTLLSRDDADWFEVGGPVEFQVRLLAGWLDGFNPAMSGVFLIRLKSRDARSIQGLTDGNQLPVGTLWARN